MKRRVELWVAVSVREESQASSGGSSTTCFEVPSDAPLLIDMGEIAKAVEKAITKLGKPPEGL